MGDAVVVNGSKQATGRVRVHAAAAVIVALLCGGCATKVQQAYDGPARPSPEVATLTGSAHRLILLFYNRTFATVPAAVDGVPAQENTGEWSLLPGPHTVEAVYVRRMLYMLGAAFFSMRRALMRQTVSFTVQAGRRYRVDSHIYGAAPGEDRYCAWVEDEETGEVVGGAQYCVPTPTAEPTPAPTPA